MHLQKYYARHAATFAESFNMNRGNITQLE